MVFHVSTLQGQGTAGVKKTRMRSDISPVPCPLMERIVAKALIVITPTVAIMVAV
jgi:hypothetical protein